MFSAQPLQTCGTTHAVGAVLQLLLPPAAAAAAAACCCFLLLLPAATIALAAASAASAIQCCCCRTAQRTNPTKFTWQRIDVCFVDSATLTAVSLHFNARPLFPLQLQHPAAAAAAVAAAAAALLLLLLCCRHCYRYRYPGRHCCWCCHVLPLQCPPAHPFNQAHLAAS